MFAPNYVVFYAFHISEITESELPTLEDNSQN